MTLGEVVDLGLATYQAEQARVARNFGLAYLAIVGPGSSGNISWEQQAACRNVNPELFFPGQGGSSREAKRICLSCEVREECLQKALDMGVNIGIWGGLSIRERRKLKAGRSSNVNQRDTIPNRSQSPGQTAQAPRRQETPRLHQVGY